MNCDVSATLSSAVRAGTAEIILVRINIRTYVRESLKFFCLQDFWLEVSMHLEGPATGHLDTGFLGFSIFKQILRWSPNSTLLLRISHAVLPN
jgi:hypothetical protein